jgi:hypothetical protein
VTWADSVKAVLWIVSMGALLFLSAGTLDWRGAQVRGFQGLQFAVRLALPSCSIFAQLCSRTLEHR